MSGRVIRAPNHLGDVVAALPAIVRDGSDVCVVRRLAPVLEMAGVPGEVLPFERGPAGFLAAVRGLRKRRYSEGVLLSAAFSAAWLFRCGGVGRLRGTATDGRSLLLRERLEPETLRRHHRTQAYALLLGQNPSEPLRPFRLSPPPHALERWHVRLPPGAGPLVGLVPGANAPARRWPAERFGAVAEAIVGRGGRVVVLGGADERDLTAEVVRVAPEALDLGAETDLAGLAAVLALCDLVVTNDTGPMHLAGAVGTPTVSVWGPSDPQEVRQLGAPDVRVDGPTLPCRPCHRNHCPRRGPGTHLEVAHEECMRLIDVNDVVQALDSALEQGRGRG